MASFYLWIKAFHVVSMVAWMAGIFYLPRLFVYHAAAAAGSESNSVFKVMERRLHNAIMVPAMLATWISGLSLIFILGEPGGWLLVKLAAVLALTGYQGLLGRHMRAFANDRNTYSGRYFRVMNEVPTVLLVLIVVMVIVKPF